MDQDLTVLLLHYLVDHLRERNPASSPVRLLNLLYLVDLAHYARHGQTLTGIEWFRSEYGPYLIGWSDLVHTTAVSHDLVVVGPEAGSNEEVQTQPSGLLTPDVRALVDEVMAQHAAQELGALLAEVNDTPPVRCGAIDAPLDFTLETDHLLLEEAKGTATDFVTLDELAEMCQECGDDD